MSRIFSQFINQVASNDFMYVILFFFFNCYLFALMKSKQALSALVLDICQYQVPVQYRC